MIAKICGITRTSDALYAVEHGATALGFVFWPESPRYVAPRRAAEIVRELPESVMPVGVFVNQAITDVTRVVAEAGVRTIQLHGDESPDYSASFDWPVWRAMSLVSVNGALPAWPAETVILLDAHDPVRRGGTGAQIDWSHAAAIARQRRVILAGGLTPDNVQQAIATVRPFGVDVSSGVEQAPGVKNHEKVAQFLERARAGLNGH